MISSLLPFLTAVVVLGIWHAALVRYAGEPGWVRTVVRVGLLATTLVQAAVYVMVQGMTVSVPVDRIPEVLGQVSWWTAWSDGTSGVLLGVVGIVLAVFTVRRWVRGPLGVVADSDEPSADASTEG